MRASAYSRPSYVAGPPSSMSFASRGSRATTRQSRRSVMPRASFSVDGVIQERYRKMIMFKRYLAALGYLGTADDETEFWDLTDRDAVDELVAFVEMEEREADAQAFSEVWQRASMMRQSMGGLLPRPTVIGNADTLNKVKIAR
mmetsp:Transcript_984/g.2162  ORF Transcript_984/g.2162 Transcript_984/m.2162 type:complete len:144 (+) Transcript_984:253-684(+)